MTNLPNLENKFRVVNQFPVLYSITNLIPDNCICKLDNILIFTTNFIN